MTKYGKKMTASITIILILLLFICVNNSPAQSKKDKKKLQKTISELLEICARVDFSDPKTIDLGMFYKAAPYIVYRGENESRRWKDVANYENPEDKRIVDDFCTRLNETVNRSVKYEFGKFFTETESEGKWFVQELIYEKNNSERKIHLAFLKIGDKFALGDID